MSRLKNCVVEPRSYLIPSSSTSVRSMKMIFAWIDTCGVRVSSPRTKTPTPRVGARHPPAPGVDPGGDRSEEHTAELPSPPQPACRLLPGKKKNTHINQYT